MKCNQVQPNSTNSEQAASALPPVKIMIFARIQVVEILDFVQSYQCLGCNNDQVSKNSNYIDLSIIQLIKLFSSNLELSTWKIWFKFWDLIFLRFDRLLWSSQVYIVKVKRRPIKTKRSIQHGLMPFDLVFIIPKACNMLLKDLNFFFLLCF